MTFSAFTDSLGGEILLDKKMLLQSISSAEEKLLAIKVLNHAEQCLKYHELTFTDFIPTGSIEAILNIVKNIKDIKFTCFGGNDECERRVIAFAPDYDEISLNDFPIKVICITMNTKFTTGLSHRDYLGSILGLGIDRSKIGDIIPLEGKTICYVKEDIADYISINLERVGRTAVKVAVEDIKELELPEKNIEEKHITVASTRLDAVLGAGFNLARGKVQTLIEGEKAFVNWGVAKSTSMQVKEGDTLSIRGFGRMKIVEIKGKTKKDRISMVIGKYV